ncbi:MAG: hypothetical protein Q9162_005176 [Coniocarpon cinnabarinum]
MPWRLHDASSHAVLTIAAPLRCVTRRSHHSAAKANPLHQRLHIRGPQNPRSKLAQVRNYASAPQDVKHVAILGGGITGLSAAHFITEEYPRAKVTILESQPRVGGWLRSTEVDTDNGIVTFESGPRSLRLQGANGALLLRLVQSLGLTDKVLVTPHSSPAAQNRFLYYPNSLIRLPGAGRFIDNLRTILTEPAFDGILRGIWREIDAPVRPPTLKDESVGDFIARRVSKDIANNLASALFHGIYAGDIWQLSTRALLPSQWEAEKRHEGLINAGAEGVFRRSSWLFCDDLECQMVAQDTPLEDVWKQKAMSASVFTFEKGQGMLVDAMEDLLMKNPNIKLRKETTAEAIKGGKGQYEIETKPTEASKSQHVPVQCSHVISTLAPHALPRLLASVDAEQTTAFPFTPSRPASAANVGVVNLYFRSPDLLLNLSPPNMNPRHLKPQGLQGFGYLIPQTVPLEQNPERALGVIFDSDITPDLYTTVSPEKAGTRLTVMLGGHYWDNWSALPSPSELEAMSLSLLQRHLGIDETPLAVRSHLHRNCIPQYYVGHGERMQRLHRALGDHEGIAVAGSWYNGVGVGDCIRSAWEVVRGLGGVRGRSGRTAVTGLERWESRPMAWCERRQGALFVTKMDEAAKGRFARVEGGLKVGGK